MFYALGSVEVSAMPYIATMLAFLAACVLVFAGAALFDSDEDNAAARMGMVAQLWPTRMHRMLRRRGVAVGPYVKTVGVARVRGQIAACRTCDRTELCDTALGSRGGATSHSHFSFCPNARTIDRHLGR